MKKEEIKSLFIVKEFTDYFVRRAKKVLKVKNSEIETTGIDVHPERGTIWVWFHCKHNLIRAQFYFDGQCFDKYDDRETGIKTEIVTQGKPEDA